MVNEINKPPQATNENAILVERLAASNRNLQEMQEEHRQLVEEMALLRQRAVELSQRAQATSDERQSDDNQATDATSQNCTTNAESTVETPPPVEDTTTSNTANHQQIEETAVINMTESSNTNTSAAASLTTSSSTEVDIAETSVAVSETITDTHAAESTEVVDDDPAAAEYLRAKMAELAALKTQFRRVQNLIDTTNLIEKHMATKEEHEETSTVSVSTESQSVEAVTLAPVQAQAQLADLLSQGSTTQASDDANSELISSMLTMFNEFSTDMRGQAESIRAERERIKALKEELISRKRSS